MPPGRRTMGGMTDRQDPPSRDAEARRIEEIFGRDLDDQESTGETEPGRDEWYRENRPPHHDPR